MLNLSATVSRRREHFGMATKIAPTAADLGVLLFAVYVAVCGVLRMAFYFKVPQPYMDEPFHVGQTQAYCADRCLNLGYCEVLEDFYDMTTKQVRKFCEDNDLQS